MSTTNPPSAPEGSYDWSTQPIPGPPAPPAPPRRSRLKTVAKYGAAGLIGLIIGSSGDSGPATSGTAGASGATVTVTAPAVTETVGSSGPVPTQTVEVVKTVTAAPAPPAVGTTIEEGTWTVGVDVQPGTYRVTEAVADCYWGIYKSGTNGEVIVSNDIVTGGRPTVTLKKGQDFTSRDCGTWAKR